jgi:hypothetical protein
MTDNPQVIGQTLSAVVGRSILSMEGAWAYRLPFAIQEVLSAIDKPLLY